MRNLWLVTEFTIKEMIKRKYNINTSITNYYSNSI